MDIDMIFFNILYFLVVFLLVFIVDYYLLSTKKEKNNKRVDKMTSQDDFIIRRYNVDMNKFSLRRLNFHVSIINGFIIAFVSTVITLINAHIVIQLAIGFVLIFSLIYSMYEIYGRFLKKKYSK